MSLEYDIINTMDTLGKQGMFDKKVKYLLYLYKVSPPLKRYFVWDLLRKMGVEMTSCQMKQRL